VQRADVDGTVRTQETDKVEISTVVEPAAPQYAKPGTTG
jgi:hypothetical protein